MTVTARAVKDQHKGYICAPLGTWGEKCQPHPVPPLTEAAVFLISMTQWCPTLSPVAAPTIQTLGRWCMVASGCVFTPKVFIRMKVHRWRRWHLLLNAAERLIFTAEVCFWWHMHTWLCLLNVIVSYWWLCTNSQRTASTCVCRSCWRSTDSYHTVIWLTEPERLFALAQVSCLFCLFSSPVSLDRTYSDLFPTVSHSLNKVNQLDDIFF